MGGDVANALIAPNLFRKTAGRGWGVGITVPPPRFMGGNPAQCGVIRLFGACAKNLHSVSEPETQRIVGAAKMIEGAPTFLREVGAPSADRLSLSAGKEADIAAYIGVFRESWGVRCWDFVSSDFVFRPLTRRCIIRRIRSLWRRLPSVAPWRYASGLVFWGVWRSSLAWPHFSSSWFSFSFLVPPFGIRRKTYCLPRLSTGKIERNRKKPPAHVHTTTHNARSVDTVGPRLIIR